MLAIQQLSMGSSKPPNLDMPFGYSFDSATSGYPFPSPPAPAPGPSLLDDNESRFLDSFFDGVSSDQFNGDFFSNTGNGSDALAFSWQDLPPTFMGTTSSFGQQPQSVTDNLSSINFAEINGHIPISGSGDPSTTSVDVLAAASLLQNGHHRRQRNLNTDVLFSDTNLPQSMVPPSVSDPVIHFEEARSRSIPSKHDDFVRDTLYAEMMFGSTTSPTEPLHRPKPSELRWGSDSGFGSGQRFVAPSNQETLEAVEQHMSQALECLEPQSSTAGSTRPSSPVITRQAETHRRRLDESDVQDEDVDTETEQRTKKRRKSKVKDEFDEGDTGEVASKSHRKRRSKPISSTVTQASSIITDSPTAAKRRKSGSLAGAKPPRENLTEDQKRENHIKSEQKRRTLIKEGFDDLGELVPELKSGGFSKSAVLVMAADWLEELIEGNKILRTQLRELQNARGL